MLLSLFGFGSVVLWVLFVRIHRGNENTMLEVVSSTFVWRDLCWLSCLQMGGSFLADNDHHS